MEGLEWGRVYWLGGSPCSGKSSIAARLAAAYDLVVYKCDDHYEQHMAQARPESQPSMAALRAMPWDDIWMRPVAAQVAAELAFYREEFPLILADLQRLAQAHATGDGSHLRLLVEGCNLLPDLVAPLLAEPGQGCWVVPTPAFQRHHYGQRAFVGHILAQCADPAQAWANWMGRDERFAVHVAAEAQARGLLAIRVDGVQPVAAVAAQIAAHYRLA